MFKGKIKWTKRMTNYLLANYNKLPLKRIARDLKINECVCRRKMNKLGLKRDPEMIKKFRKESQFQKGSIPPNKGKKGTHFSPASEFKKGHIPVNKLYNGCIRLRHNYKRNISYFVIRIGPMKWVDLNRYLWQKYNGPIPKGFLIVYKDGNSLNCTIENLKMISMAEKAKRNRNPNTDKNIARFIFRKNFVDDIDMIIKEFPELIELKRFQLKLRRTINEHRR